MSATDTTETEITIELPLHDDYPEFDDWCDEQEFEYQREQSEAVDYVNTVVDHDKLDEIIQTNVSFIVELGSGEITHSVDSIETVFEEMGFERDSTAWDTATTHVHEYIDHRITYYRRRLE